ncbi:class IV adenylate cyclase [bacterium]|nr:class IV adenylate cyclase [bacterium]
MPRNVEIKARLHDPEAALAAAAALGTSPPVIIRQVDTFFRSSRGRLKLRDFGDGKGELIFYDRPDREGPKTSHYAICPVDDPRVLTEVLGPACGTTGTVSKTRTLVMAGRTRIHLDEVADLGWFLELEVVLEPDEPEAAGMAEAFALMEKLGVDRSDLVTGAYLDLLGRSG